MSEDRRAQPDRRAGIRRGGRRASDPPPEWVSISEFARRYGVARGTVYKWLAEEILVVYRVGSLIRVRNIPPDAHRAMTE